VDRTPSDDGALAGLSARNRLHGVIEEVRIDGLLAQMRLRVGGQHLTAVITADAVTALGLRRGDEAIAVIKSTEVMIARGSLAPQADAPRMRKPRPPMPRRR
jgi:molybdopterin-binding protein